MPIEFTWIVPDKILLSRWWDHVSEDDMRVLVEELGLILDSAEQLIHTVADMSDIKSMDDDAVYYYFRSRIPTHPRRGRVAMVNPPFQSAVLTDMFNRVSEREMFRQFGTRDAARAYLLSHDTPPPALRPGDELSA